jgi:hypothetical protein
MKVGRIIGCGPKRPKPTPGTVLPDEKHCCQSTQSPGPPITASHTTTSIILPSMIYFPPLLPNSGTELLRHSIYAIDQQEHSKRHIRLMLLNNKFTNLVINEGINYRLITFCIFSGNSAIVLGGKVQKPIEKLFCHLFPTVTKVLE